MRNQITIHQTTSGLLALLLSVLLPVIGLNIPLAHGAPVAQLTPASVTAEALGEANLRSGPGIEFALAGQIMRGTRYAVIARHEFVPWLLIEYPPAPEGKAWVFADLVALTGSLTSVPLIADAVLLATATATPTSGTTQTAVATDQAPLPTGTAPPAAGTVFLEVDTEVNVRFGPGVDYPRIGQLQPASQYAVISRHALFPWLLIAYPDAPDGVGWVFDDVVTISGDLFSLPVITAEQVGWPTLTPTPPFVVTTAPPWQQAVSTSTASTATDVQALGERILAYLLSLGFAPEEDRFASVFLMDLSSGQNFSMGRDIAYSGMSLIKIPILVEFYRQINQPASAQEAEYIVNTMICSGNHTANTLLSIIGGGDEFDGAQRVTQTMQELGLKNTFVAAPFKLGDEPIEIRPVAVPDIPADQERAVPDPFNQTTPEDLGWLLSAVYTCAVNESGPLFDTYPGAFTATECRQIIQTMSSNQINVLTEAGVPFGTRVAHKHGWIDDTHGDAAIVFTPGGDFVLTLALHQPGWLPYEESWPAMAEITRLAYNTYNPDEPLDAIHPATVDETCNLQGNPLLGELQQSLVPPLN